MQAVMISSGLAGTGFLDAAGRPALRLTYRLPVQLMPLLTAASRVVMGGAVGMMFGALTGNGMVWTGLGIALGVALDAIASRAGAAETSRAAPEPAGPYRVR